MNQSTRNSIEGCLNRIDLCTHVIEGKLEPAIAGVESVEAAYKEIHARTDYIRDYLMLEDRNE